MHDGQTLIPNQGETITCRRSSSHGGRFEYEVTLDGEHDAPPLHAHDCDEEIHVDQGRIELVFEHERKVLAAGESFVIPAGTFHTFRNVSVGEKLLAHGSHNAFFEHLIDQFDEGGGFLRLAVTLQSPAGKRAYAVKPSVRWVLRVAAVIGRLVGVRERGAPPGASQPSAAVVA